MRHGKQNEDSPKCFGGNQRRLEAEESVQLRLGLFGAGFETRRTALVRLVVVVVGVALTASLVEEVTGCSQAGQQDQRR